MSEHTPGPWSIDPEFDNQAVLGPDGVQVADCSITCNPKFGKRTDAINSANASLIAAAPDLLDALDEALGELQGDNQSMLIRLSHTVARDPLPLVSAKNARD